MIKISDFIKMLQITQDESGDLYIEDISRDEYGNLKIQYRKEEI